MRIPGEYVTDFVGDSGNMEHANLSALKTKGLGLSCLSITNCNKARKFRLRNGFLCQRKALVNVLNYLGNKDINACMF